MTARRRTETVRCGAAGPWDSRRVLACATAMIGLVACGSSSAGTPEDSLPLAEPPIDRALVVSAESGGDYESSRVAGVLVVEDRCTYFDGPAGTRTTLIWPSGAQWGEQAGTVIVAAGVVRAGEYISAVGAYMEAIDARSLASAQSLSSLDACIEGGVALLRRDVTTSTAPGWTPPTSTSP